MVFRSLCGPLFDSRYAAVTDKTTGLAKLKPVDFAKETASVAQAFAMSLRVLSPDVRPRLFLRSDMPYSLKSSSSSRPRPPAACCCSAVTSRGSAVHHRAPPRVPPRRALHLARCCPARRSSVRRSSVAMRSVGEGSPRRRRRSGPCCAPRCSPRRSREIAKACKIFAKRGSRTDIKRFIQTVELTACRAGFLVSNDLDSSVAMLSQLESAGPDDLSPTEKTKELIPVQRLAGVLPPA